MISWIGLSAEYDGYRSSFLWRNIMSLPALNNLERSVFVSLSIIAKSATNNVLSLSYLSVRLAELESEGTLFRLDIATQIFHAL